jgi:hypothetical protein
MHVGDVGAVREFGGEERDGISHAPNSMAGAVTRERPSPGPTA